MSRLFEIVDVNLSHGHQARWVGTGWAVLDRGKVVALALTEDDAQVALRAHKETLASTCPHERGSASFEGGVLTVECGECGMVGEVDFSTSTDVVWIGQQ